MLPHSPPLSSMRQINEWMRRPYEFFGRCQERHGDLFTLNIPALGDVVIVAQPDLVKEVFAQGPDAAHAGKANVVLRPFLGDHSLLLLDGAPHQRHRRMVMPAFHGDRVASYGASMLSLTAEAVDRVPLGRRFSGHDVLQDLTLRIIVRTVFGVEAGPRFTELASLLGQALDVIAWPPMLASWMQLDLGPWSPWGKFVRLARRVDALLQAEMDEAREQGVAGRTDILALLLGARDDQGQGLSDLELKQELLTLLVAGHETTATALSWALRWTLDDVPLRERLVAEADRLAAGGALDPASVARSELLDGVVKEALRLTPVIPLVGRVMQKPLRLGRYELPVGTRVAPSIFL
ncbi:MAG: cytochrome P450, partial [Myxococcales bacterium]